MFEAHWVPVFDDIADHLVEESLGSTVRGKDGHRAAPSGDGFGHSIKEPLIAVKGELIQDDVAGFSREGYWARSGRGLSPQPSLHGTEKGKKASAQLGGPHP